MRLFIALSPPEEGRAALERDLAVLRSACRRGGFSRSENLHITLAFLGEVSETRLGDVRSAMEKCHTAPFDVTIGSLGRFPGREGDTIILRAEGGEALRALQRELSRRLRERGFALEDRPYRPHLTLARRAAFREGEDPARIAPRLEKVTFTAEEMILFLSHRPDGVLTYTPLYVRKF